MTNTTDLRYQLDSPRVTGRRQVKVSCPQCGRKRCFVRYVDTRDQCRYVHDTVGRCDHEQSCGYHYRPSEFFRDRPWERPADGRQSGTAYTPPPLPPLQPLPMDYVRRWHSGQSVFWQWMTTDAARRLHLSDDDLLRVFTDYQLGATRQGDVIFWQIDVQGRVRSGHVMAYRNDGHREGRQTWFHTLLQRQGLLPLDFPLYQCLFGEHLLTSRPEAHVCVVESEKTALLMAAYLPEHVWLATCGSNGLKPERLQCLRGRRVTVFPDSGCLDKWSRQMRQTQGISYNIAAHLEQYPANTDLADLLLREV